ncbi:serine O-acetyltransferase [Arthrobacter nitrophenolicus]|uniref:serine O-acetyltransferase n=1 Tax=Arthrobacter nitrophenolicus TaxID=683150 RepID=UPI003899958F
MSLISRLIYLRRSPLKRLVKEVLALYGVEVPSTVEVGPGLRVLHRGFGTVIHGSTRIGSRVTIYQGVTVGRGDVWVPGNESKMDRVIVEDGAVLCAGAKILGKAGTLTVGANTVVGANAVLTMSTGPNEIWAGVPARKVGVRP